MNKKRLAHRPWSEAGPNLDMGIRPPASVLPQGMEAAYSICTYKNAERLVVPARCSLFFFNNPATFVSSQPSRSSM